MQDSERLQLRSHDLEHQLSSKEKELEHLFQKQKKVSACSWLEFSGAVFMCNSHVFIQNHVTKDGI